MPNTNDKAAADILTDVGRVVGTSAILAHHGSALVQSQSFRGRTDRAFHPIGWVLQFHLTVEFCGQIPLDQSSAKPRTPGRQNWRPVPLAPAQAKLTTLSLGCQGPGDFDIPLIVRQRAIFGRIGPEFMQGQSKGQRRLRTKTDLRAFRPNPVPAAPRIGCKNAVDDSPQIDSGPVRLEQYVVRMGESFETRTERGAGVLHRHIKPQRRIRDRLHHCKRILEPMTYFVDVDATACVLARSSATSRTCCRSLALVSLKLCSASIPACFSKKRRRSTSRTRSASRFWRSRLSLPIAAGVLSWLKHLSLLMR